MFKLVKQFLELIGLKVCSDKEQTSEGGKSVEYLGVDYDVSASASGKLKVSLNAKKRQKICDAILELRDAANKSRNVPVKLFRRVTGLVNFLVSSTWVTLYRHACAPLFDFTKGNKR